MFWCRPAKLWYVKNFIIDNIRPPIHCNTVFMINNLLKLHKNARLSLFVEIGGVLYPQSTTSIANNGARSYLKKSRQALEKKNHQTDQKFPIFSLHPFPPQLCTFLLLHTHTPVPYQALFWPKWHDFYIVLNCHLWFMKPRKHSRTLCNIVSKKGFAM